MHDFFLAVLGLAAMELTFFIAVHMLLWFAFVAKTLLVTYQSFGYF